MNDFNSNHDEMMFDRLVDGELSARERQQLLASLDQRDDGWRRCALAFLESQSLQSQFQEFLAEPIRLQARATAVPAPFRKSNVSTWLAVAASMLLMFSLGWLVNRPQPTTEQGTRVVTIEREESPLRDEPLASEDAITLLVRDTSGKNQRLQVPLLDVEALDQRLGAVLPGELRDRLRNHGLDVQRRRRYAPMFFEQDEQLVPMVVPVDDTYLVPVEHAVY